MGFRFESLEIYQQALDISKLIFQVVNDLQNKKQYGLADQLARACLSISNNIAEGSGSNSKRDFANFLNISRRSLFECASMVIILSDNEMINTAQRVEILRLLDSLSRRIQTLRRTLLNN